MVSWNFSNLSTRGSWHWNEYIPYGRVHLSVFRDISFLSGAGILCKSYSVECQQSSQALSPSLSQIIYTNSSTRYEDVLSRSPPGATARPKHQSRHSSAPPLEAPIERDVHDMTTANIPCPNNNYSSCQLTTDVIKFSLHKGGMTAACGKTHPDTK